MNEVLLIAFTTGAFGSVGHCLGMCGGFCIAITGAGREAAPPSAWRAQAGYHIGRTITYSALGALFGALGSVGSIGGALGPVLNTAVAVLAGLVMIYAGLAVLGVFSENAGPTALLPQRFFRRALAPQGRTPFPYGLRAGLILGLLPCGLLLAAEAQAAATHSILGGAAVMGVFAQGTVPALAFGSALLERLSLHLRRKIHGLAGVLLILWGGWSLARPFLPHEHGTHDHHHAKVEIRMIQAANHPELLPQQFDSSQKSATK